MNIPTADQEDYEQALQELYDLLDQAYWVASTIEAKDALNGLSQAVDDILTTLHQGALDTNTNTYTTLKTTVAAVNAKLSSVQNQINNWIHVIKIATQISGKIDQVINSAVKVFPSP
jgi:hypothetical protein